MPLPYSGAGTSGTFKQRWLTAAMIGANAPCGTVEVRRGHLNRTFHPYNDFGGKVFGEYPGARGHGFWYADWTPTGPWILLDAVKNIRVEQSFDNNGVAAATILMDNMLMSEVTGNAGVLYHVVEKGYYSPLRGYVAPGRPNVGQPRTPLFRQIPNAQIRVRQGYGTDTLVTTFLGLVDDLDIGSVPNQITVTARDFGGVLVDQAFFGWAKEKLIQDPITFAPRDIAENRKRLGGGAQASSSKEGHTPGAVTTVDSHDVWVSQAHSAPYVTEWVEIHVPAGRYSSIYLNTSYSHLHAYIGVFAKARGTPSGGYYRPTFNGTPIDQPQIQAGAEQTDQKGHTVTTGWFDPNDVRVPGAEGGWAYQGEISATTGGKGVEIPLGGEFNMGDNSVIRVGFRNLQRDGSVNDDGTPVYRCSVKRLAGIRQSLTQNAIKGNWIIIDDVTDIVRCCLRWAGFKQWEIQNAGVNLKQSYVADKAKSFMDVIKVIRDMLGYVFFIGEPLDDSDDEDIGFPVFRNNRVFEGRSLPTASIDDKLLLTGARLRITNQPERFVIRARGMNKNNGVPLGSDTVKRVMYAYLPPWFDQMAGVVKHLTHTDPLYTTVTDCQVACYLLALQIALAKYTAIIDTPGNPGIGLDTLQSVIDRQQGLNSRIYVTNRLSEMALGTDGHWTLELGGSLVDTPDVTGIVTDWVGAIPSLDRNDATQPDRKRQAYGSNVPQVVAEEAARHGL